jgi:hypothetical protein
LNHDFIGANKFKEFIDLIKKQSFQQFFPTYPFGGNGIQDELSDVLKLAFKHVRLAAKATVKEDLGIRMQEAPDRAMTNRDPPLHRLHDRKRHG